MRRVRRFIYWLPALAWMTAIFLGSTGLLASQQTSRFLAPLLRWLWPGLSEDRLWATIFWLRKGAHMAEYALLALLVLAALNRTFRPWPATWSWARAGWALLICAGYAVSDELHQAFEPARFGSALDVVIDSVGAAAALGLLWCWGRWRRRW